MYVEKLERVEKIHKTDWVLKKIIYSDEDLIWYTYWKRRMKMTWSQRTSIFIIKNPNLDSTWYYNQVEKFLIRTIGGSSGQANQNEDEAMKHSFFSKKMAD